MKYLLPGLILLVTIFSISCNKDDDSINTGNPGICDNAGITIESRVSADTVFINGKGGIAPYSYSINGSFFSLINTFTNLDLGETNLYVQDSRGCIAVSKISVDYKSTVYDSRNAYTYKAAKIGQQVWIAENMKYSVSGYTTCYDDNDENCKNLGTLYFRKNIGSVCPSGYRLPTIADFNILTDTLSKLGNTYDLITTTGGNQFEAKLNGYKQNGYININQGTAFWTNDFSVNGSDTLYTAFEITAPDQVTFNNNFKDSSAAYVRCIRN